MVKIIYFLPTFSCRKLQKGIKILHGLFNHLIIFSQHINVVRDPMKSAS
jgi:hypothetical protein